MFSVLGFVGRVVFVIYFLGFGEWMGESFVSCGGLSRTLGTFVAASHSCGLTVFGVKLFRPRLSRTLSRCLRANILPRVSTNRVNFGRVVNGANYGRVRTFFGVSGLVGGTRCEGRFVGVSFKEGW